MWQIIAKREDKKKKNNMKKKLPVVFLLLTVKHEASLRFRSEALEASELSMAPRFRLSVTAPLLPLALMLNCSCVIVSLGSPFPFSWVTDMTFRYTGLQLLSPRN